MADKHSRSPCTILILTSSEFQIIQCRTRMWK